MFVVIFNKKEKFVVDQKNLEIIKRNFISDDTFFFTKIGTTQDIEVGVKRGEIKTIDIFPCDDKPAIQ